MGAKLAASGALAEPPRIVSGGFLGRALAGAAVRRARHWAWPVCGGGHRRAVASGAISLAGPRRGAEPSRPRLRPPPSPGDRPHRYARDPGSDGARAVAGAR